MLPNSLDITITQKTLSIKRFILAFFNSYRNYYQYSIVFILCSIAAFAIPPRVIGVIPENGTMNVSPGQVEIQISFNQDMSRTGYALWGNDNKIPEMIGKPRWSGKRTFAFTANLKPDQEYDFQINTRKQSKLFRNLQGEPAETFHVYFKTTEWNNQAVTNGIQASDQHKAAFEKLKHSMMTYYSYKNDKNVNWENLFSRNQKRLSEADDPEKFARIAAMMLAEVEDWHIKLVASGKTFLTCKDSVAPNMNFKIVEKTVPRFFKKSNIVYTGQYPDGIGYILITSWSIEKADLDILFKVLQNFSGLPSLIIDVRTNGGGNDSMSSQFAGCFIDQPVIYAKQESIDLEDPLGRFKPVQDRVLNPTKNAPHYNGKVALLIGPATTSSAENFTLMMKQVPNCVTLGDITRGSTGNPKPYDLGNGVTVYLPSWRGLQPDGKCFEGVGIEPDIMVKNWFDRKSKTDLVISEALQLLRNKKL